MEKVVSSVVIKYRNHLQSKLMGWFLCNGNTGLKWQRGRMVKVNIIFIYFLLLLAQINK